MQRQSWLSSLTANIKRQKLCDTTDNLHLVQEIREFVNESIIRHRFISGDHCSHQFKVGITGPRKSGKSTLLQLYSEQVALELVVGGDWKQVFMFVLDVKDFLPFMHDFESFYKMWVDALCEQVGRQRCSAAKWIPDIRRFLESQVTVPITLQFSKCYIVSSAQRQTSERIVALGKQIHSAWDSGNLDWWFTCVLSLSLTLPAVVGFRKTLFVIDNLEFADVEVRPCGQFIASDAAFFGEHLKHVLKQGDYIFACQDLENLYYFMEPEDEDGVDMMKGTHFVTTYGIADSSTENDPPLMLRLEGEQIPFVFKPEFLDGVPNYILLWNDLNTLIDQVAVHGEGTDEREDAVYFAVAHAQALVDLVFVPADGSRVKVVDVRRASKGEQVALKEEEVAHDEQMKADLAGVASDAQEEPKMPTDGGIDPGV
jgi:hypothetical protein